MSRNDYMVNHLKNNESRWSTTIAEHFNLDNKQVGKLSEYYLDLYCAIPELKSLDEIPNYLDKVWSETGPYPLSEILDMLYNLEELSSKIRAEEILL